MRRPLSIVLAEAFDRGAREVFEAPQAHEYFGDPEPTKLELWIYWCRGFAAGLAGDHFAQPLWDRFRKCVRTRLTGLKLAAITKVKRHQPTSNGDQR